MYTSSGTCAQPASIALEEETNDQGKWRGLCSVVGCWGDEEKATELLSSTKELPRSDVTTLRYEWLTVGLWMTIVISCKAHKEHSSIPTVEMGLWSSPVMGGDVLKVASVAPRE